MSTATAGTTATRPGWSGSSSARRRCSASCTRENFPVKWAAGAANFAFDDDWEKRNVWVVEGVSKLPQYAYSKRVIFIDKETWVVLYSDIYDRAGKLWKVWINDFSFRKQAFPGADIKYRDEMRLPPAIVMVDMQLVARDQGEPAEPTLPGRAGLVFQPGGGFRYDPRVVHRCGDGRCGALASLAGGARRSASFSFGTSPRELGRLHG